MRKVTRRNFLKFGFASAAVVGLGCSLSGCLSPPSESAKKILRTAGNLERETFFNLLAYYLKLM